MAREKNPFFLNKGPLTLRYILKHCNIKGNLKNTDLKLQNINELASAKQNEITFFHSLKYKDIASNTKASVCITTNRLQNFLPKNCIKIIVDNVLLISAKITELFYPNSINDHFDVKLNFSEKVFSKKNKIIFGKNVLIGKNVSIGKNTLIGHNTIIERNVKIGKNCSVGSNVILRNTILEDNVHILDGCVIGKKGFGFIPNKDNNFRYPHIGYVKIEKNSEIGSGCTIDRGSLSNTVIGKNTYFDNQVHLAHNVKIGNNCIIAGQVGIAGSAVIGNNVMIGGQAGVSGHLKIGNNVQIGGGSGVVKDIPDNKKVMGYPATSIKSFIQKMEA